MQEGLIKDAYELIIKELQSIITILYLLMIAIGMLFNYKKYDRYDINIFEYADVFDFLIAPFQDIRIIMVSLLALFFPLLILWFDIFANRKFPKTYSKINLGWDKKPWYNKFRICAFSFLILYVIFEAANGYGNFLKNNPDRLQTVTVVYNNTEITKGQQLGKTSEVIFLLVDQKIKVIPYLSLVKEIQYE